MLSLKNRLKEGKDFNYVYKKGRSAFLEGMFVKFLENGRGVSRVGFSVGLKFSKKAVDRNKIKRLLRAIMRQETKNMKKGFDVIIVPQKIKEGETYGEIEEKVKNILKKAGLSNK